MPPDIKVSGLPSDSALDGNHYFPLNDPSGPTTKRTTLTTLLSYIGANLSPADMAVLMAGVVTSENLLINGGCDVWQRNVTATPNDDVYTGCDRWNFLTETNGAWTVARDTDVPAAGGSKYSMKFSNITLNNQCGIVSILEAKDAAKLIGGVASLSFQAKTNGTEIAKLRAAILSWTGTEDAVTSDVVSAWGQNGTNPTWATNWTMENTPVDLSLTSSWQRFAADNVALDASGAKNIAVVIWVDDGTITAGDDFFITQVQLNVGAKANQFRAVPFMDELLRCQRYYFKTFPYATTPAQAAGVTGALTATGLAASQYATHSTLDWQVRMRTTPTVTGYNPISANGLARDTYGNADLPTTDLTDVSDRGVAPIYVLTAAGAQAHRVRHHITADAEL